MNRILVPEMKGKVLVKNPLVFGMGNIIIIRLLGNLQVPPVPNDKVSVRKGIYILYQYFPMISSKNSLKMNGGMVDWNGIMLSSCGNCIRKSIINSRYLQYLFILLLQVRT